MSLDQDLYFYATINDDINAIISTDNELPRGRAHEVSIRLFSSKTFYHT